jgi:Uma2 family endonuclease
MKQYTNEIQTAKLIELGFEKPSMAAPSLKWVNGEPTFEPQYTIGELIEMLPTIVDDFTLWIGRDERSNQWFVKYHPRTLVVDEELIDALYDMIVKLKEEGVI